METYYESEEYSTSKIIPLPFVNASPSNYDTILTVLIEAATKCQAMGQEHSFVTFDQPLYWKAREIVTSIDPQKDEYNLSSIIIGLGGFHILMSFLGSIGFVMEGSGLKEAFNQIFAENSSEKALIGHAFSRAVRGHSLVQIALANIIFSTINFSEVELIELDSAIANLENKNSNNFMDNETFSQINQKMKSHLKSIAENGPTAALRYSTFI